MVSRGNPWYDEKPVIFSRGRLWKNLFVISSVYDQSAAAEEDRALYEEPGVFPFLLPGVFPSSSEGE